MNIHAGDYVMLNAMNAVNVYRVAWSDNDKVGVFINDDACAFDKKCIKSVYKLVRVGTNCKYLRKIIDRLS